MKTLASAIALFLCGSVVGFAADQTAEDRQQAERERYRLDVRSILRAEQNGSLTDRERLLKPILNSENAPDEAYWQAGFIRQGDDWISVRDRPLTSQQEAQLNEYAKVRSQVEDSPENHWQLARWCYQHELFEQCRAHLMAILLDHPDHAGLREMLGYQKIGNRWMNAEDYEAAVREADLLAKELAEWGPQVASIRDDLTNPVLLKRNGAKTRLKDIRDVAAIPALEMILLPASDKAAALCVEQLCEIDHRRASIALCKAAMFLPDSSAATKQAAIEELKTRPYEDYVPVLLNQLSTPFTDRIKVVTRTNLKENSLAILLQAVGKNESRFEQNKIVHNQIIEAPIIRIELAIGQPGFALYSDNIRGKSMQERMNRLFNEKIRYGEKQLEAIDQQQLEQNHQIDGLLTKITNIRNHSSPQDWWSWWDSYSDTSTDQKTNRTFEVTEFEQIEEPFVVIAIRHSCFVAGTPVWTERGAIPIEQLRVGDMALSKDAETGEVAYRPIIRTTIRDPRPLVTVDFGTEQITATEGHPFWVSGKGWVKARELSNGHKIHTPTGTITVEKVTPTNAEKVYNLVVDGFHTYFVGMSQVLVHDVSITSPTDAVVPGLIER